MTKITILDGGMSRELTRQGAVLAQPQWSALALMNEPEKVAMAHEAFANAGAKILTTNSYALVPFHLGQEDFDNKGAELATLSGSIARQIADKFDGTQVAGCLPPACGSYVPEQFNPEQATTILGVLVQALEPHINFWIAETMSSTQEAEHTAKAIGQSDKPIWISYTLADDAAAIASSEAKLRSGESIQAAVQTAIAAQAKAILFNCSQPEVMENAIKSAKEYLADQKLDIPLGVYANTFEGHGEEEDSGANETIHQLRADITEDDYVIWAKKWVEAGASIIGGCCGITAPHIERLSEAFA